MLAWWFDDTSYEVTSSQESIFLSAENFWGPWQKEEKGIKCKALLLERGKNLVQQRCSELTTYSVTESLTCVTQYQQTSSWPGSEHRTQLVKGSTICLCTTICAQHHASSMFEGTLVQAILEHRECFLIRVALRPFGYAIIQLSGKAANLWRRCVILSVSKQQGYSVHQQRPNKNGCSPPLMSCSMLLVHSF